MTWYGYLQTSAFVTLVGATAIIPYIIYFLITAGYAYKRRTLDSIPGAFSLGRWAWPVIIFVLIYSALIIVVLSVPGPFHAADKVVALRRWPRPAVVRGRAGLAAAARHGRREADRGTRRLTGADSHTAAAHNRIARRVRIWGTWRSPGCARVWLSAPASGFGWPYLLPLAGNPRLSVVPECLGSVTFLTNSVRTGRTETEEGLD